MIIDAHCHAGPGDGFTGPWDTAAPLGAYLRRARAAGIDRTVIFPAFHTDYRAANRAVAARVRRDPRLLGFAFVHAARDAGHVDELVEEAVAGGLVGLKVHRADAPITREVCEAARRHDLPVLYDVVGEVHTVGLFARAFPDVRFIIPHLGSFAGDWRAHVGLIDELSRNPNVSTDSAGVQRFDHLVELVRRLGPERLLFGSDGPWLHPAVELKKIQLLGLPKEQEANVSGLNLLRLLPRRLAVTHGPSTTTAPPSWR